jgi:hypothetical protein
VHSLVQTMNAQEVLLLRKYKKKYGGTFLVIGSSEIKAEHLHVRYLGRGRETGDKKRPVGFEFRSACRPAQKRSISATSSINRVRNRIIC